MLNANTPDWQTPVLHLLQKRSSYLNLKHGEDFAWVFRDPVVGHLATVLYLLDKEGKIELSAQTRQAAEITYFTNIASWVRREYQLKAVLEMLDNAGIVVIPFKGAILQSQLYRNSGLRPMGDIDILVCPEDYLPAARLLLEQGFRLILESGFQNLSELENLAAELQPGELAFKGPQGLAIDLHQNPVTFHWFSPAYALNIPGIWERSILLSDEQRNQKEFGNGLWKRIFSEYDTLGYLCLHLALHGLQAKRSLLDIDLWIRNLPETWQWERFLEIVNQWKIRSVVFHAFSICKDLMQTPLPDGLLDTLDPGWFARIRVKSLITSQSILADRPTFGKRYPTLVKLALVDRFSTILVMLIQAAFPSKEWRKHNSSWRGLLSHWLHILHVVKRGD